MDNRILAPVLFLLALITLGYAVYRSSAEVITTTENGRQVVYGEPQHGLLLGLCLFAGICILAASRAMRQPSVHVRDETTTVRPGTTGGTRAATNYPH